MRDCFTLAGFAMTAFCVTARSGCDAAVSDSSMEGTAPCEAKAGLSRRERVFKISMDGKF
ncbi:hypothetical protein [Geovibrio ferrireducens]|uniref:hypothetical protein n=1 Tax=Geovibrio ferrireducens TaxID=46201 RepID=UPI0022456C57|nr:hypothetical protein [Geovibrio ferrireducens]